MNTGPLTFNSIVPTYTVFGGEKCSHTSGVSAVLLNRRGSYSRKNYFRALEKAGFDQVISLENHGKHYELDELKEAFPFIRFIILQENISLGEQINIAALEISSPLFFVLWDDLYILHDATAEDIAEKLIFTTQDPEKIEQNYNFCKRLCTIPIIQNEHYETIPTSIAPIISKKKFETLQYTAAKEGDATLCPYSGCGIYDRKRFIKIGGFDVKIKNNHWQFMDFGLRAWLWGEELRTTQQIKLKLDSNPAVFDTTADGSYRRFFLKNIAPVFNQNNSDGAHLPLRLFLPFVTKSGDSFFTALSDFFSVRNWVNKNSKNFVRDSGDIALMWV